MSDYDYEVDDEKNPSAKSAPAMAEEPTMVEEPPNRKVPPPSLPGFPTSRMRRKASRGTSPMRSFQAAGIDVGVGMDTGPSPSVTGDPEEPLMHEPSVREPSVREPSLQQPEQEEPRPSVNSAKRGRAEARAQRKLRASARSNSPGIITAVSAPTIEEPGAITAPLKMAPSIFAPEGPDEPALTRPGAVSSSGGDSRVSRKIRASMTPASNIKPASASNLRPAPVSVAIVEPEGPDEPAMIRPGTVTSVPASGDSRVSRKIRASMTPSLKTAPIDVAIAAPEGPEEPAMIRPGTVTSVSASSDSRVSREIRSASSSLKAAPVAAGLTDVAVVAPEGLDEPDMFRPGTVTSVSASSDSRVSRKIRAAGGAGAVSATASQDSSVQRKMSANRPPGTTVGSAAGMAAMASESFDDEPEGSAMPGTAVASTNHRSSRAARKIAQAQAGVGASASTDDSAVGRKSGKSRSRGGGMRGAAGAAGVGAVSATGDDPAAQKNKSFVNDSLFSNDEGVEINPDDYLMQQVKATQEAQSKKVNKKKKEKSSDGLQKDGVAALPKQAGAYSIKGGRGWFTGGFRQRAPMLMRRRQPAVRDDAVSEAAQEFVDEDEDCWDRVDKPTVYVGICIVIFLIIAVTVPVSLVSNEDPAPTPSPTSARFFVRDEFQLVFSTVSNPESFEDPNSAQSQALNWIVYDDGLGLSPNDDAAIQRYVAMVIYFGNGGEGWDGARLDTSWGSSIPECEWDYVVCTANQTIGELGFLGVGLTGTLEAEMLNLTELSSLDLAGNKLSEVEFPSLILQMTNLIELFLDTNELQGSIPSEIANLRRLEKLIMNSNDFTGSLPIEMRSMTSLISFQVPLNRLEGDVFNVVTGWPDLKTLDLGNNDFFGTIPSQLGLQRSLAKISLERNDFRGSLPTELGDLTDLRSLVVTQNFRLDGFLPTELGNCEQLEILQFSSNNFVGTIPTEYGNLLSLRDLRFQQNEMTGAIPTELGMLTALELLDCSNNEFVDEVPSQLGELTALKAIYFQATDVTGSMPEEICALRGGALASLIAECFDVNAQIKCEKPECCTRCN
jgi:hypothetical protein